MSKNSQWMPLYIGDYLADTTKLTIEQSGAYLHLLMSCWRTGYVPDDDAQLAAICRVSTQKWSHGMSEIIRPFFTSDGEKLTNKRLDIEREKSALLSAKQRKKKADWWEEKKAAELNEINVVSSECGSTAVEPTRARSTTTTTEEESLESKIQPSAGAEAAPLAERIPDIRSELWSEGLAIVRGITGKPEAASRAIVGRLAKACRDDCASAMAILRDARDIRPAGDPVAWVMAAALARDDPDARLMAAVGLAPSRTIDGDAQEIQGRLLQ